MEITEEFKTEIVAGLKTGAKVVTFTKVNGDKRVMTCTLQEGVIPPATKTDPLSQKKVRAVNPEVCSVWDVNAQGWRSFRWANVVEVTDAT
jgi:hypothetical protein